MWERSPLIRICKFVWNWLTRAFSILFTGRPRSSSWNPRSTVPKPYPCYKCTRSYTNKSTLNRHLREECGKMPQYVCRFCPKAFKQRSNFQRHVWTVHGYILWSIMRYKNHSKNDNRTVVCYYRRATIFNESYCIEKFSSLEYPSCP